MNNQKQTPSPSPLSLLRDAQEEHARLFGAESTRARVARTIRFYRREGILTYRQAVLATAEELETRVEEEWFRIVGAL
jgi:hypothetical protein